MIITKALRIDFNAVNLLDEKYWSGRGTDRLVPQRQEVLARCDLQVLIAGRSA